MLPLIISFMLSGMQLPFNELIAPPIDLSRSELYAIATSSAAKYKLSPKMTKRMIQTITCESLWEVKAISPTGDYGIVQLNKKAHPEITEKQMFDPYYSLDYMASEFSRGRQRAWVCYSLLWPS